MSTRENPLLRSDVTSAQPSRNSVRTNPLLAPDTTFEPVVSKEPDNPNLDFTDAVSGGFRRGMYNVAGSIGSVGSLAQMQAGDDLEDYFQQKAEDIPRAATLENFLDSPKNFVTAVGENLAEQVPNALAFFLTRGATKRAALSRGLSEKAAGRLGNVVGGATTVPLNIAESKQAIEDRGQEATFSNTLPVAAFNTALDSAILVQVARKFGLGKEAKEALQETGILNGLWRIGKDTVEVAATEGVTEVMQTAANQAAARIINSEGFANLTEQDKRELLESGIFGMLGGGGLAGVASTAGQAAGLFGGTPQGVTDQGGGLVPTAEPGPQGANKQGPYDAPPSSPEQVTEQPIKTPDEQFLDEETQEKPVDPQPEMGEPGTNGPPSVTDDSPLTQIVDPRADEFSPEEQRVRERAVVLDALLRRDGIDMDQEFHTLAQGQFTDPQQAAAVAELAAYQERIESGDLREDIFEDLPSVTPEALQGIRWQDFQFSDVPDGAGVAVDPQDPESSLTKEADPLTQAIAREQRLREQRLKGFERRLEELAMGGYLPGDEQFTDPARADGPVVKALQSLGLDPNKGKRFKGTVVRLNLSTQKLRRYLNNKNIPESQLTLDRDGPLKLTDMQNVQPGTVESAGIRELLGDEAYQQVMDTITPWVKKVLPNRRILLAPIEIMRNFPGVDITTMGGGHASIGQDGSLITLDPKILLDSLQDTSKRQGQNRQGLLLDVLVHEIAHAVVKEQYFKMDQRIQNALQRTYAQYLNDAGTMKFGDWLDKWVPRIEGSYRRDIANQAGELSMPAIDLMKKRFGDPLTAFLSFDEFLARGIARWAEREGSLDNLLPAETKSFWAGAVNMLRRLFTVSKAGTKPNQTFDRFMESIIARNSIQAQRAEQGLSPLSLDKDGRYTTERRQVAKDVAAATEQMAPMPQGQRPPYPLKASVEAMDLGLVNEARDTDDHGQVQLRWRKLLSILTPLQIAERFKVKEAAEYMDQVDAFNRTKMEQIERADRIAVDWRKLSKNQADTLGQFLFEVSQRSDELGRRLTNEELIALGRKMNLSASGFDLWQRIDTSFRDLLDHIEQGLVVEAEQTIEVDAELQDRIFDIRKQMGTLRERNYFPRSRFGNYTVRLRAREDGTVWDGKKYQKGQTIEFRTYETERERAKDVAILRKKSMPGIGVSIGKLDDTQYSFMGMPPVMIESIKRALDQGEQGMSQDQKDRLNDIALQMNPGRSFLRHLQERKGIKGFSEDAMRTYANYMMNASNHLARVQHNRAMFGKIKDMDDKIRYIAQSGDFSDTTTLDEIRSYYKRHFDYVMNPDNDWAKLRAMGFLWYLGANVKSALVNTTQVPMVTYPVLAGQYGDTASLRAITKAMKDTRLQIEKAQHLSEDEQWMMAEMTKEGIIDESMVMELAGMGESTVLSRLAPGNSFDRSLNWASYYGGWMFRTAEKWNRRVTALAAFRLALENGKERAVAFDEAKEAIRKSQFEYAKWNRPEFMRGKKSVIFLFWQYMQHASYLATNGFFSGRAEGRKQAMRFWMMSMLIGGLQGLPFAEHILDMLDIFGTKTKEALGLPDPKVNLREDARNFITELEGNPDLLMHGLSKYYGLGPVHLLELMGAPIPNTDVSGSLSLGRMIPWLDNSLQQSDNPDAKLGRVLVDVLGPVGAIPYNLYRTMESPSPDVWKNVERNLPVFLKSVGRGIRYGVRGAETDRGDAELVSFDPEDIEHRLEIAATTLGFTPTRVSKKWDLVGSQQEARMYWSLRRSMLLDDMAHALAMGDREEMAEIRKAMRGFNQQLAPELRPLTITMDTVKKSMRNRKRARILRERGLPTQRAFRPLFREIEQRRQSGNEEQQ